MTVDDVIKIATPIAVIVAAVMTKMASNRAEASAKEAKEKLEVVAKTGALTHALVNSASIIQLKLYAVAARRIATLTNDEADIKLAVKAEKLVKDRESEQAQAISEHG